MDSSHHKVDEFDLPRVVYDVPKKVEVPRHKITSTSLTGSFWQEYHWYADFLAKHGKGWNK